MLNPFVTLFNNILQLYMVCVIAWTVVSTLVSFKILNEYQPIVRKLMFALDRLCEPVLAQIRKYIPNLGGLDVSPIILILLINFLQNVLRQYLYNL